MESINYPLSNIQLELLKLFSRNVEESDLREIKQLLVQYFAKKLENEANRIWEEKGWTDETMDEFLKTHMRTPYKIEK